MVLGYLVNIIMDYGIDMRNSFLSFLGNILDFYGYIFCEASFRLSTWIDKHFVYNEEKDKYEGFLGFLLDRIVFTNLYKLGCWFYNKASVICWERIKDTNIK